MRIDNIRIEQFGRVSNASLEALTPGLNVVHSPRGTGKTTTIDFVQWMLFGNANDRFSGRLRESRRPASGMLTISRGGSLHKLVREDDGTRCGRIALDGDQRIEGPGTHLAGLLGDVTWRDFALLCTPLGVRETDLGDLLCTTLARGLELTRRPLPSERVQELRLRVDSYRRDLDRLPFRDRDLNWLTDRRRTLQHRLDAVTDEHCRHRSDVDREHEELRRRMEACEAEVESCREQWHDRDEEVSARRRELEVAVRAGEEAKQELLRHRRMALAETESHLESARGMLAEVQRRDARVDGDLRDFQATRSAASQESPPSCPVETLAEKLDELRELEPFREDYRDIYRVRGRQASRVVSSAEIDSLRQEVSRLCRTLQEQREAQRAAALSTELKHLRDCEAALDSWISHLSSQRDQFADELTKAHRDGVSLVLNGGRPPLGSDVTAAVHSGQLRAVSHSCDAYETVDPEDDVHLRQLIRQRESAADELETAERHLRQIMDRRRELESGAARLLDREIETIQRDLHDLEGQIRNAEQRQRLEYEIRDLESEISRLRGDPQNSPVLDRAVQILDRLAGHRITGIRVENTRQVVVEFATGNRTAYPELTRADRDQVYLSLCLALASSLRQQGTELPLLLDDVFAGDDSQRDHELAAILNELAQQNHQIVIFTSHEQVFRYFSEMRAHLVPWGKRLTEPVRVDERLREDVIDHVRFKPRTGIAHSASRDTVRRGDDSRYDEAYDRKLRNDQSRTVAGDDSSATSLSRATDLVDVTMIDSDTVARLRRMGAVNVGDFLQMPPAEIQRELTRAGLNNRPVQQWQDELGLRCAIRGLTADDASQLVACGVSSVAELAQLQPEVLSARLRNLSPTEVRSPSLTETEEVVVEWVRAARRAYPDYRRRWGSDQRTESRRQRSGPDEDSRRGSGDPPRRRSGVQVDWEDVKTPARRRQKSRRRQRAGSTEVKTASDPSRLRFYLNPEDPVVDAPSIGPRTAERLHKARIRTVADLLAIDPDDAVDRVDYARIKTNTVRDWQAQALMACSVPQLRGHDAQILVSCDVKNADQLATADADELWAKVRQFVKTADGKRVLRNGKKPDISEVRDWIRWGQHARQLSGVRL